MQTFGDVVTVDDCVSCQQPRRLHERRDVAVALRRDEQAEPDDAGRRRRWDAGRGRRSLWSTLLSQREEVTPPKNWPAPLFLDMVFK